MTQPWYATREHVMRALDSKPAARNAAQIDRAVASASRDIDALCHRTFAPQLETRYFDWPNRQSAPSWRLWLDSNDLISVTSLDSGGTAVDSGDYFLRRADDRNEPPFTCVEINLGGSAAFSSGSTHQRAIGITGLWGYANTESPAGTLSGSLTANATSAAVTGQAAAALGAGSVIRVGSERMRVTGRTMTDTGQTLATDIDKQVATALVPVADASGYAVDETILIDAERMLIVDIAGSNLIVKRAWDGTANATHSTGAVIYGLRSLTVARGELGTTAAAHSSADAVNRWDPPGLVQDLAIAEAISRLTSETAGYTRALRSGEGSSERNRDQNALKSLRESVYVAHGRKARIRAV